MTQSQPSVKTSLIEITKKLAKEPPCRIFLKCEYEQPSGSFKLRGMGHLIGTSLEEASKSGKKIEVFSSSGGNAGLAAAYASKHYGFPCTVVLPVSSKPVVIEKLEGLGAKVVVHGKHWGEADGYLRDDVIKHLDDSIYPVYCHPFEHPLLWDGHGKFIDEIVEEKQLTPEELSKVKGVVCSVGGGGLYNGVVNGLERNEELKDVPVLAIETHQTPTFKVAVEAGKVVHLNEINTLSTSLGSPYVSEKSLSNYKSHKTSLEVIDDLDAVKGMIDFYDLTGNLTEPACGASLSVAFDKIQLLKDFGELEKDDIVIIVACGGSGVSASTLEDYRKLVNERDAKEKI
ncbi:tryptophan synthase beta subunit-like PLP-dependent enzyme [Scheffersomyces xylosifermentans]|uniref:tryptophan synthase beta subunit-like PLP-dependent enzyme n=1 Tax=Scheffersomyces xylosifermentans TaxID=1304137 RepID=UPI00315D7781